MPHQKFLEQAQQHLQAARHLLRVTFPTLKDPKLLPGVTAQLFAAGEAALEALLRYERQLRLIPPFGNSFASKFRVFRSSSAKRNHFHQEQVRLLGELQELVSLQKSCPVEFRRQEGYVLATDRFCLRTISKRDVESYFSRTQDFVAEIGKRLQKTDFHRK